MTVGYYGTFLERCSIRAVKPGGVGHGGARHARLWTFGALHPIPQPVGWRRHSAADAPLHRGARPKDGFVTTAAALSTPQETAFAVEQKKHLVKTLRRFDMVFFTVAVIVGLDLIGQAASNGFEALTWTVVLVVLFLIPYGLVMAEVGSAFTAEGGPYEWVKLTMGRFWAGLNTIFYWVTNPLWVGGSLAFIGTAAWSSGVSNIGSGSFWDYTFKFLFVWASISSAIISFRVGKWIPTLGAILKVALVSFFAVTVLIYGFDHGFQGIVASHLKPTSAGLLAIAPLILFSFVGFEGQNGAAEEMLDPQRDVPQSILRSGALSAFCYLVPILLVLLVLPASKISGLGGFLDAVKASYTIYGGAASFMYGVTCVLFILTLMNSGSAWMMCGDRVLAVASADGGFFPYFGTFHPRLGTPLRANLLSGVIATVVLVCSHPAAEVRRRHPPSASFSTSRSRRRSFPTS